MTRNTGMDFVCKTQKIGETRCPESAFPLIYFLLAWQKLLSALGSVMGVFIKELNHMPAKPLLGFWKKYG